MNFITCILDLTDVDHLTVDDINDAVKTEACRLAGFDVEELGFDR